MVKVKDVGLLFVLILMQTGSSSNRVTQIGEDASTPTPVLESAPEYTEEARLAGLEGTVLLSMIIDANGHPEDISVKRPLGLGLDERAVETVSTWRFRPAKRGGHPVSVKATVEVSFRAREVYTRSSAHQFEPSWHLVRARCFPPEGASRPIVESAEHPTSSNSLPSAMLSVSFEVDPNGMPTNFDQVPDLDAKHELISMLKNWRFKPALKQATPLPSSCTFDFVWGAKQAQSSGGAVWTLPSAALRGQLDVVAILLKEGSDPNVAGPDGNTPLHNAALKGNTAIVEMLIKSGAKLDVVSNSGTYPLHEAALSGNASTVRTLLTAGADVDFTVKQTGETALHIAAAWGKVDVIQALLAAGARIDIRDAKGYTPLELAVASGQEQAASTLQAGNIKNKIQ